MNIKEFKKGDYIVRIGATDKYGDRSYIGEKLMFVGIANGCAYFDRLECYSFEKKRIRLELDIWSNNWEYWEDINDLQNEPNKQAKYDFKQVINKAIENEDFELISEFKNILEDTLKKYTSK